LAEPDYGGRIDYPKDLEALGDLQRFALQKQGADPQIGRRLGEIFNRAGIKIFDAGVLGGQWRGNLTRHEWELEWNVLLSDLQALSDTGIEEKKIEALRSLDWVAWERGERVLFVPTFYAWGKVIA
jgi:hypothetical protein